MQLVMTKVFSGHLSLHISFSQAWQGTRLCQHQRGMSRITQTWAGKLCL